MRISIPRGASRRRTWAVSAVLATAAATLSVPAFAVLTGAPGSFQASDGDMVGAGGTDWASVSFKHVTDPSGGSDDSYLSGSKQDTDCTPINPHVNPGKDDFTDVASYAGQGSNGHTFLYGATIRSTANGSASEAVELKQGTNGPCKDSAGNPIVDSHGTPLLKFTPGDKLLAIDYTQGGVAVAVNALTWVGSGACYVSNDVAPCWGATVQTPDKITAEGKTNQSPITAGNNPINAQALVANQFAEFGIDLTASNIIPATACTGFAQALWGSRTSGSSFVSSIKDVTLENNPVNTCGEIKIRKVTKNGDDSFAFATTGANYPGFSLTGTSPTNLSDVSGLQPGTYTVTEAISSAQKANGWALTDLTCAPAQGSGTSVTVDKASGKLTITLANNGVIDCTYTNHHTNSPSLSTLLDKTSNAQSGLPGDGFFDTATLTGATTTAGGQVTYTVYSDSTCQTVYKNAGTKDVSNAAVPQSDTVTLDAEGTYYWQATYTGDADNAKATSPCTDEVATIAKKSPTIATLLSGPSGKTNTQQGYPGDSVTDSSTLAGASSDAGGTVTYTAYSDSACTKVYVNGDPKTVVNGVVPDADPVTLSLVGSYWFQASYSGDSRNNPATSKCSEETAVITQNPTSITTAINGVAPTATVAVGSTVFDTATLTGATSDAGGKVTYTLYADSACTTEVASGGEKDVVNGVPAKSDVVGPLDAGTYYWGASYSGDSKNLGSADCDATHPAVEVLTVTPASPSATTAQDLIPNDSFKLSGGYQATGKVTFSLYGPGDPTCSGAPSYGPVAVDLANDTAATANTTFHATTPGTWRWLVTYAGDNNNKKVTLACGTEQFTISNN